MAISWFCCIKIVFILPELSVFAEIRKTSQLEKMSKFAEDSILSKRMLSFFQKVFLGKLEGGDKAGIWSCAYFFFVESPDFGFLHFFADQSFFRSQKFFTNRFLSVWCSPVKTLLQWSTKFVEISWSFLQIIRLLTVGSKSNKKNQFSIW